MAKSKISESETLRQEAEEAKTAIKHSLSKAKDALNHKIDPRELTRRHPWVAIGTAAAAGFAAMVIAVPSKHERELRRLERLREAMSPPPPPQPAETNGTKPAEKHSWAGVVLKEVIQLIRPILMTAITASIKAGANSPPPPQAEPPADPHGPDNSREMP